MHRSLAAVLCLMAGPALAEPLPTVVAARLAQPTLRYDHAVLGDGVEWGALELTIAPCAQCAQPTAPDEQRKRLTIRLPLSRVFEDITVRVADLNGDGAAEAVVVETDIARGAALAVYDALGHRAATASLGATHRWLAPAGIADLDGDGQIEIAYVDRPHVSRELVILHYTGKQGATPAALTEVARLPGLTNHRIGDSVITGGVRTCAQGPELLLLNPDWSRLISVRFDRGKLTTRDQGPFSPKSLKRAMACR